jgi:two-component system, LytTR family, sensor kinase
MRDKDAADLIPNGQEPPKRIVLASILGFWFFYAAIVTLRAYVMDFPSQGEMALRRGFVMGIGVVVTLLLWQMLRRFIHRPLHHQVVLVLALVLPCAAVSAASNYYFFNIYDPSSLVDFEKLKPPMEMRPTAAQEIAEIGISRYFFLIAWCAFYLALGFAQRVQASERRAADYARAAQTAELRALRYQVNPHFLFNTLNSLSALVMNHRHEEAESMIMNLSNFYRTSLAGEPVEDVTLAEEIQLQRLYLEIEGVRFPDRLKAEVDLPKELEAAPVPGLILQPLVENAVKHGVSRTTAPVQVEIRAHREGDELVLTVSDNGPPLKLVSLGDGGIGLANVRDRLAARFGAAATLEAEAVPSGGFTAVIRLPLVRDGK